jgi:tRNA A-37 threonylcarbamoyl transferase component Bud32
MTAREQKKSSQSNSKALSMTGRERDKSSPVSATIILPPVTSPLTEATVNLTPERDGDATVITASGDDTLIESAPTTEKTVLIDATNVAAEATVNLAAESDGNATVINESNDVKLTAKPVPAQKTSRGASTSAAASAQKTAASPAGNFPRLGPYELLAELGAGGMGKVYKARHPKLQRIVAIKVMLRAAEKDRARFLTEARLTAQLKHPNIVAIHDITSDGDTDYIVMEFIDGESLLSQMHKTRMSPRKSLEIMKTVAMAVDYAHGSNIIHRDLKPANIMIEKATGRPVVMDFGLAKKLKQEKDLTKSGEILGTPKYMSPEQAGGYRRQISPSSDIYTLGAILYEMLAGVAAVDGDTPFNIIYRIINQNVVPLRQRNPNLSPELEAICTKAMEKEPLKRYQSAAAFADDIERFLNGEAIMAKPHPVWYTGWQWCRRRKWAISSLLLMALLVGGGLFWGSWLLEKQAMEQQWANWWQKCQQKIKDDAKTLAYCERLLQKRRHLGAKIAPDLQEWEAKRQQVLQAQKKGAGENRLLLEWYQFNFAETAAVDNFFGRWSQYDEEIFKMWSEYTDKGHLEKNHNLIASYQQMNDEYRQLQINQHSDYQATLKAQQQRHWHVVVTSLRELEPSLPGAARHNPGQQLPPAVPVYPAKAIVEWLQTRHKQLEEEIKQYLQPNNAEHDIASGNLGSLSEQWELANWLVRYASTLDRGNTHTAELLEKQFQRQCDTANKFNIELAILHQDASQQRNLLVEATMAFQRLCFYNSSYAPAYYHLGRSLHISGWKQIARHCYEKAQQRENSFLASHYTDEIKFEEIHKEICEYVGGDRSQRKLTPEKQKSLSEKIDSLWQQGGSDQVYQIYQKTRELWKGLLKQEFKTCLISARDVKKHTMLNFYLTPPTITRKIVDYQSTTDQENYHRGIQLYKNMLNQLHTIASQQQDAILKADIAYFQGLICLDLGLLGEMPPAREDSYLVQARQFIEHAVELQPFYPEAWETLAELYYFFRDFAKVATAYRNLFEIGVIHGDPKNKAPWEFKDYTKYVVCLLNQKKVSEAKEALAASIAKWQEWKSEHHKYPRETSLLVWQYILQMLLSWKDLKVLAQIAEEGLSWRKFNSPHPDIEALFYAVVQLKLGKPDAAKEAFLDLLKVNQEVQDVFKSPDTKRFIGMLANLLKYYNDPFLAKPEARKMPAPLSRELESKFDTKYAGLLNFMMRIANDPVFSKYFLDVISDDPTLDQEFAKMMQDPKIAGFPIRLSFVFHLYAKGGIDMNEDYLMAMWEDPSASAQLCYDKAIACYRRSLHETDATTRLELVQRALRNVIIAIEKEPGVLQHHYAAALLYSQLGEQNPADLDRAYLHLELAFQLAGQHKNEPCQYTPNDPAFERLSVSDSKRFAQALAAKSFKSYTWLDIQQTVAKYENDDFRRMIANCYLAFLKQQMQSYPPLDQK